jgi:hypothetical protein
LVYLKSALVGITVVLGAFVVLWLFFFAVSSAGLGIDLPPRHVVVSICWVIAILVFLSGFFVAMRWQKKRNRAQPTL